MDSIEVTYRLIDLDDPTNVGMTALSPELAICAPGRLDRSGRRLAMERTEWTNRGDRMAASRSVVIDIEAAPGAWKIGSEASVPTAEAA